MTQDQNALIAHVERELGALRQEAKTLSHAYPQLAAALGIHGVLEAAPHVESLLQGVAYLNARVHYRLDRHTERLAKRMLLRLQPAWLADCPPLAMMHCRPLHPLSENRRHDEHQLALGCEWRQTDADGLDLSLRSAWDLVWQPFGLTVCNSTQRQDALVQRIGSQPNRSALSFGFKLHGLIHHPLRFWIAGSGRLPWLLWDYLQYCIGAVRFQFNGFERVIEQSPTSPANLEKHGLWPTSSDQSWGSIVNFFAFPEAMRFLDVPMLSVDDQQNVFDKHAGACHGMIEYIEKPILTRQQQQIAEAWHELKGGWTEFWQSPDQCLINNCVPVANCVSLATQPVMIGSESQAIYLQPESGQMASPEILAVKHVSVQTTSPQANHYQATKGYIDSSAGSGAMPPMGSQPLFREWLAEQSPSGDAQSGHDSAGQRTSSRWLLRLSAAHKTASLAMTEPFQEIVSAVVICHQAKALQSWLASSRAFMKGWRHLAEAPQSPSMFLQGHLLCAEFNRRHSGSDDETSWHLLAAFHYDLDALMANDGELFLSTWRLWAEQFVDRPLVSSAFLSRPWYECLQGLVLTRQWLHARAGHYPARMMGQRIQLLCDRRLAQEISLTAIFRVLVDWLSGLCPVQQILAVDLIDAETQETVMTSPWYVGRRQVLAETLYPGHDL